MSLRIHFVVSEDAGEPKTPCASPARVDAPQEMASKSLPALCSNPIAAATELELSLSHEAPCIIPTPYAALMNKNEDGEEAG